ncbi:unnamed protein product, partial [marine sediment metagenome]
MSVNEEDNNEKKNKKRTKRSIGSKLIGNIGEDIVAYELFLRGWMPTKNYLGGFDLLAIKQKEIRKIEVKTRTIERKPKEVSEKLRRIFMVSKNELDESDFIICILYPLIKRAFIVKSSDVPREKDGKGRINVYLSGKNDDIFPEAQKYG